MVHPVDLGGKYSGSTRIARDPMNGMLWLIKPGTEKISPAAGVAEERASQAQREAAFYAVASAFGLGMAIPKTFLIKINDMPTAVMPFLPQEFKPLAFYKKKDPNWAILAFDKYRKSGMLHMWAILEWVLGSADSHSNNILMSPDGSCALIDHGATFSGNDFNPGQDDNSFVPYYLRYRAEKGFKKLDAKEKFNRLAQVDSRIDDMLKNWLNHINVSEIQTLIQSFGINPEPSIKRLNDLRAHEKSLSEYVNFLWTHPNPLIQQELTQIIKTEIIKELILGEMTK